MNTKQATMLASISAMILVATVILVSGKVGKVIAFNPTGNPDYTLAPMTPNYVTIGQATKILVEIESPYGHETINTINVFQTSNLMQKSGYITLRLQGNIMSDKRTLLHWIDDDLKKIPDGLAIDGVWLRAGDYARMSKPNEGATIDVTPMTGKVTLKLLEGNQDMYETRQPLRQIEFSGCHVAGYELGSRSDERRPYLNPGTEHFEQVDFACTNIEDVNGESMNSRGIIVDKALNNDGREIVNEKGELIINSREYRQSIVVDNEQKELEKARLEIVTSAVSDRASHNIGDVATFRVTFTDLQGNPIDPDTIKAYYDDRIVELLQDDAGSYTYTTPVLTKANHQLIVSAEKTDFATDTTYLSIPIHRIS